jgi:hypothetical protein
MAHEAQQRALDALDRMKRFDARLAALDRLEGFDARFHLETGRPIEPWELREASDQTLAHNSRYSPTPVRTIRQVIAAARPTPDDMFVDFGAGKGRVMLVASEFPFASIVGVEFSETLCDIARRNISRYTANTHERRQFQVCCQDAAVFEIPPAASVLYFYEPFSAVIGEQVLRHIEDSLRRHPRHVRLCFVGTGLNSLISRHPCWTPLESVPSPDDPYYDAQVFACH